MKSAKLVLEPNLSTPSPNLLGQKIKELNLDLTEEQVIEEIRRVVSLFSHDLKFPTFDEEDILQEAYIIALKQIDKFKTSKSSGKGKNTLIHKLGSYLFVVLLRRISNLRRDKFCRNDPPCKDCYQNNFCEGNEPCDRFKNWKRRNDVKMNVYNAYSLSSKDENRSFDVEDMHVDIPCPNSEKMFGGIDLKDTVEIIRSKLSAEQLENFNILCDGGKISHAKKAALLEAIHDLLGGDN